MYRQTAKFGVIWNFVLGLATLTCVAAGQAQVRGGGEPSYRFPSTQPRSTPDSCYYEYRACEFDCSIGLDEREALDCIAECRCDRTLCAFLEDGCFIPMNKELVRICSWRGAQLGFCLGKGKPVGSVEKSKR